MISFKKALLALSIGIGMSTAASVGAAPGCTNCRGMGIQCLAGNQIYCDSFERYGCGRYGEPGEISCDIVI
jgi:hypothetical protein